MSVVPATQEQPGQHRLHRIEPEQMRLSLASREFLASPEKVGEAEAYTVFQERHTLSRKPSLTQGCLSISCRKRGPRGR